MVEVTKGFSRVLTNRRWDDYESMKQYHNNRYIEEVIISGWGTTANAEFEFASETTDWIGTAAQAYIRCEADDGNQDLKYVYLQYQKEDGTVMPWVTADISNAPDSTTEVAIGAADFWRVRQMYSQVESATGGGAMITLTDADMGGNDNWAYIEDGNSRVSIQRFFTQDAATATCYLGRVVADCVTIAEAAAAQQGVVLTVTYTPAVLNYGEVGVAADITQVIEFVGYLNWQPCIELAPATEVKFSWNHSTTAHEVNFEAVMLDVYAKSQPSA